MQLRKSLILLPILSVMVLLSHLGLVRNEMGMMLTVDERPIDVIGNVENQLNKWTRRCGAVKHLTIADQEYQLAKNLIDAYSPPDSSNSTIVSAWSMGSWVLAEVEFKDLLPAVVMIEKVNAAPAIVPDAVWSGYTNPHRPAPFIRKFLIQKLDAPPLALINCFEPQSNAFK